MTSEIRITKLTYDLNIAKEKRKSVWTTNERMRFLGEGRRRGVRFRGAKAEQQWRRRPCEGERSGFRGDGDGSTKGRRGGGGGGIHVSMLSSFGDVFLKCERGGPIRKADGKR